MANGEPVSDERQALQELGRLAQTLNAMRKDGSRPSLEPAPGSVLAGDDRRMAPWHLSHTAWTSLTTGVEHLEAATRHISQFRRLDPHAPYAQVRAGLEAAATALWVLAPASRIERMTRGLKIAATDVTESAEVQRITGLLPQSGKTPEQRKDEIRNLAEVLKLPVDRVCSPIKHRQVVRGAARDAEAIGERMDEDYVELVWRLCGGFIHARSWVGMAHLDREIFSRSGDVAQVRMTGSMGRLLAPLMTAVKMAQVGRRLYELRRLPPV